MSVNPPAVDVVAVLTVAEDAARRAGALLRERLGQVEEIRHKGAVDIVTDVDVASERLIRATVLAAFPNHAFLGEEGGASGTATAWGRWIVDPIDGTTNYAHGFPFFCVSVGFESAGMVQAGVIYDPVRDEMFAARLGGGATLNRRPIRVSTEPSLAQALLATGFPYDRRLFARALRGFEALSLRSLAVRRAGSAALDLAYVACGRFDAYWEYDIRPWDVAAGALLVREAGGTVTRVDGTAFTVEGGEVLATNGALRAEMLAALAALTDVPAST